MAPCSQFGVSQNIGPPEMWLFPLVPLSHQAKLHLDPKRVFAFQVPLGATWCHLVSRNLALGVRCGWSERIQTPPFSGWVLRGTRDTGVWGEQMSKTGVLFQEFTIQLPLEGTTGGPQTSSCLNFKRLLGGPVVSTKRRLRPWSKRTNKTKQLGPKVVPQIRHMLIDVCRFYWLRMA